MIEYIRKNGGERGHWEYVDTGVTEGQHFDSLDPEDRREYLKAKVIHVEGVKGDDGRMVRVVIDGKDHGLHGYPDKPKAVTPGWTAVTRYPPSPP